MKKIITILIALVVMSATFSACGIARKDVMINLTELRTDAAMKQFKKAKKQNQLEILTELVRQANLAYEKAETIEDMYELRDQLTAIHRYVVSAKQSFMSVQSDLNSLTSRVNRTIREFEGGTTVYHRGDTPGLYDFGQELD